MRQFHDGKCVILLKLIINILEDLIFKIVSFKETDNLIILWYFWPIDCKSMAFKDGNKIVQDFFLND